MRAVARASCLCRTEEASSSVQRQPLVPSAHPMERAALGTDFTHTMFVLVTYDVSTVEKAGQRRLRRVAQACEDYGVRVQKSVFECQLGPAQWVQLRHRLLREIKPEEDSLRFYFLDETAKAKTEHHGVDKPVDLTEPLIL